jgi:hypothetical protein
MKQVYVTLFLLWLSIGYIFGQDSDGDYRTRAVGSWNQVATWEVYNGGWVALNNLSAGIYQNIIPSDISGVITVRNNVTITQNINLNQVVVESPAFLRINAGFTVRFVEDGVNTPLRINSNAFLYNFGTLDLQSQLSSTPCQVAGELYGGNLSTIQISNPSLLVFNSGGRYRHVHASGGNIPLAMWDVNSSCIINGLTKYTSPAVPGNLGQAFGNFMWDTPGLGSSSSFSLGGALTTVNGSLILRSTNNRAVRFSSILPGYNLVVGGDVTIQTGVYWLTANQSSPSSITIGGNLIMQSGTLILGTYNNSAIDIRLNGNFQKTGGTITRGTGTGFGTIRFNGGAVQTYSNNSNITTAIHFAVENGSTLDLGTNFLSGTGRFTLNSGTTLNVGSIDTGGAIQLGSTRGNIRTTGVRTYASGSTVVYEGAAQQYIGAAHPAASNTIIDNPTSVTMVTNVTIGGTFTIAQGAFDVGANRTLTLNRNITVNGTFVAQQGRVIFGGSGPQVVSGSSNISFFDVAVNQTASTSLDLTTAVAIESTLDINSGSTLNAGTNLLTLVSTPIRTANVSALASGASIVGTVIVERYLPKAVERHELYHVASPVTNSTIVDWRNDGLPIVRAYRWDEPTRDYVRVFNSTPTTSGIGFLLDVNDEKPDTLDSRGTLGQGNIAVPLTAQSPVVDGPDGWNHIGNPYPSAIDWDNISLAPGVHNSIYFTDNFGNSGQGTEPGVVVTYVDGVGTPATYSGEIAQGQGFWVKATANTTLTFTEAAKIVSTNTQFFKKGEIPNVLRIMVKGEGLKDEAVIRLREGATDKFDGQYDAYKYLKNDFNIATLTADNVKAVINAYGTSECNKNIPLVTEGAQQGAYTLNFVGLESFESFINIYLIDLVEDKTIDIRKQQEYAFAITDKNIDLAASRFQIHIEGNVPTVDNAISAVGESVCEDQATAVIMLDNSEHGVKYTAEWNGVEISESFEGTGSPLQMTISAAALLSGENHVTIKAQAGICTMSELSIKPVITKLASGKVTIVQGGGVCKEGSATLVVSGANEGGWYHWYESADDVEPIQGALGSEFVIPNLIKSKSYFVATVNELGCEGSKVEVKAVVSYPEEVNLSVEGNKLISSSTSNNQWFWNDLLLKGETSNTLHASESGIYTLKVTNGNCISTETIEITAEEEAGINIFPNPTQNKVVIRVRTANNNVVATLVNTQGIEIGSKHLTGEGSVKETEFDLLPYASGIYNIRISDGQKLVIKKIAKTK